MEARLESVWFDQNKYELAEAKFQSLLARNHKDLVVEVNYLKLAPILFNNSIYVRVRGSRLKQCLYLQK